MKNEKRKRRYREKKSPQQIFISSTHEYGRIHDSLKGWGEVCKDGSILWDHYRPPTKRQIQKRINSEKRLRRNRIKAGKNPDLPEITIPIINEAFPHILAEYIVNVQPMSTRRLNI